jgi:hypothetical protein
MARPQVADITVGRSTYTIEVLNNRGRVVETIETTRRSQEGAHRVARQHLANYPNGTRMVLRREGEVVENLTRTKAGWEYTVLNGETVRGAQRDWVLSHTPKQRNKASTGKARTNRNNAA